MIKLEIAMDYAVDWKFDRILRDLIQNFYDSIGWKNFFKEFHMDHSYTLRDKNILRLRTAGHPFSYEWLNYIGGSTKTGTTGKYVGMYGEGFKICALCLKRAGKHICMESEDWRLTACTYTEIVGGMKVKMLGYHIEKRKDDGWTTLTISGLSDLEVDQTKEACLNFYYPENPLLGPILVRSRNYAVHLRSDMDIPCRDRVRIPGILYCNYLARGRLPVKMVLVLPTDLRDRDSRSRKTFEEYESITLLNYFAKKIDPRGSYQILTHLKSCWNDVPKRMIDFDTLYYFICQLVRNIASSREYKNKFMKKYRNLIYIDRPTSDRTQAKRISEAAAWSKSNPAYLHSFFVNPIFRKLGAKSVLKEYEKSVESIPVEQMPSEIEKLCRILFQAFEIAFYRRVYDERPEVTIVSSHHTDPMQYCERNYRKNKSGKRYKIHKVAIDRRFFSKKNFKNALLELSGILLHVYGRDKSAAMNCALTDLGAGLLDHASELSELENIWENSFDLKEESADNA